VLSKFEIANFPQIQAKPQTVKIAIPNHSPMNLKLFKRFLIKHEKALYIILVLLTTFIALLQFLKINVGILTNYGADLIAPILIYYWTRKSKGVIASLLNNYNTPKTTFLLVLSGCVVWEIRQKLFQGYGIFDSADIFVYVIALVLCYITDITNVNYD